MARDGLRTSVLRHGPRILGEVGVNVVLPVLVHDQLKPGLGEVGALMASSLPPMAWSLVEFARRRRLDALSLLSLAGIALSLLAFLGTGSVRVLQLRERLVTVAISLVFLGSAAIGRPLMYEVARAGLKRRAPDELARFEALRDDPRFRRSMTLMTLVWGFGWLGEAAAATALVLRLSVHDYLVVSPVLGYGVMGALSLWTFLYVRQQRRRRGAGGEASPASPVVLPAAAA
jgi:hypothetical protein